MEATTSVQAPQANTEVTQNTETATNDQAISQTDAKTIQSNDTAKAKDVASAEEMTIINKFMSKMNLPKGTEPLLDKAGNLTFLVKMDGQQYQVTPEELVKGFNLNQVGYQRLSEAKRLEQGIKQNIDRIVRNPDELFNVAKEIGISEDKLEQAVVKFLENKTKYMNMTPEERAQEEYRRKLDAERAEIERTRQETMQAKYTMELNQAKEKYSREFIEAMGKRGYDNLKLENGEKAEILLEAVGIMKQFQLSKQNISAYDAIGLAEQRFKRSFSRMLNQYDDNHIIKMLPPRIIEAIRKNSVKELNSTPTDSSIERLGQRVNLNGKHQKPKKQLLSDWL